MFRLYVPSSAGVSHATSPAPTLIGGAIGAPEPEGTTAVVVDESGERSVETTVPARSALPPTTMTMASAASAPNGASQASPVRRVGRRRLSTASHAGTVRGPDRRADARCSARIPRMDRAPREPGTPPRPGNTDGFAN